MADLTLERATDGSEHYEVLDEARNVVGHIVLSDAAPPEMPWIWSVVSGHHTGRKSTHGYEATRGGHGGFRKGLASGMTELSLKKSGRRLEDHYDVIADGVVVGRIMMFTTTPAGQPWLWTIAPGYEEDRAHTHGYAETKEAAMQAFVRSWHRQT